MTSFSSSLAPAPRAADIERSLRGLILYGFASAIFWLIVGCLLQVVASLKLLAPGFLDGMAFFTYGRVQPAGLVALVHGWASLAGLSFGIWMLGRLSGSPGRGVVLPVCALSLWNLALGCGVLAILAGAGTGLAGLELPGPLAFALLLAFVLVAGWALFVFRGGEDSIARTFFLGGIFCFTWLYATANGFLVWGTTPGSAMGAIQGWFENGLFGLWLTFLALAVLFHLLPAAVGRPLHSSGLSAIAFWGLLLFVGCGGLRGFVGGPFPAWMISVSVVATFLLVIPALAVVVNLHATLAEDGARVCLAPASRFLVLGLAAFATWIAGLAFVTIPTISSLFHFTFFGSALTQIMLFGFVTMTLTGAIYTLLPRLGLQPCTRSMALHFWIMAVGIGTIATCAPVAGMLQGFALSDPMVTFQNSITYAAPFRFLELLAQVAFLFANLGFAAVLAKALFQPAGDLAAVPASEEVAAR